MGALGAKLRSASGAGGFKSIMHWCPGCDEAHGISIERPSGPKWTFNGDYDRPTFGPSIRIFVTETTDDDDKPLPAPVERTLCHYFIIDGKIQFCGDCEHKLSGQTVDLPDWPGTSRAYGGIDE